MNYKKWLIIVLVSLLFIPLIQSNLNIVELNNLNGDFTPAPDMWFRVKDWFTGNYQKNKENYLNDNFGLHNMFIRTNNQLNFNLFRKAHAKGVIVGKENYLYEEDYIKSYYGKDFIGADTINKMVHQLKFIQEALAKLDKTFVFVFAASKGSFYPEFFPDYEKSDEGVTNYECFLKEMQEQKVNFIDFDKYFIDNKYKSKYPLFPRYGIHWSHYAECLVTDSIARYIEKLRNIRMPHLYWDKVDMHPPESWTADMDIEFGMNLLFPLHEYDLAYPELKYEDDNGKIKPSIIAVTDSYYFRIFRLGFGRIFSNSQFWFYNRQIFKDTTYQNPVNYTDINVKDELLSHDIVLIMATEPTLKHVGWNFINEAYTIFANGKEYDKIIFIKEVDQVMASIKATKDWYDKIVLKAKQSNIPIDSALRLDAIWVVNNRHKN